jgi:hypothetical protein
MELGEPMPKQLDEQRFQCAVRSLALHTAKTRVIDQIRADGLKLGQFSCAELNAKRDAYFASHMEELIAKALVDVWKLPSFARYKPAPGSQPVG